MKSSDWGSVEPQSRLHDQKLLRGAKYTPQLHGRPTDCPAHGVTIGMMDAIDSKVQPHHHLVDLWRMIVNVNSSRLWSIIRQKQGKVPGDLVISCYMKVRPDKLIGVSILESRMYLLIISRFSECKKSIWAGGMILAYSARCPVFISRNKPENGSWPKIRYFCISSLPTLVVILFMSVLLFCLAQYVFLQNQITLEAWTITLSDRIAFLPCELDFRALQAWLPTTEWNHSNVFFTVICNVAFADILAGTAIDINFYSIPLIFRTTPHVRGNAKRDATIQLTLQRKAEHAYPRDWGFWCKFARCDFST